MKPFMDKDFILETPAAQSLYHSYAAEMPIIDYHCHINPAEIAQDKRYASITEVWLGGDHYKWRAMRANGIPEAGITGKDTDPYVIFENWAKTLPKAIGNPLYHWTYLELARYFGITEPLNAASARRIYEACNQRLAQPDMSVRGIIRQSNVKLLCTTDDPVDDLHWHREIKADSTFDVQVLPAFRPDKALQIHKEGFAAYIKELSRVSGIAITSYADLEKALEDRIAFFAENGCVTADHGLDAVCFACADPGELDEILGKGLQEGRVTCTEQADKFRTALLLFLARQYAKRGWVMQIHYGCVRNNSAKMFERLGPDTGFDAIGPAQGANELSMLLNAMEQQGSLPKMVLYSLNDNDNAGIAAMAGCFLANAECPGKIQLGSAWWFNDTKSGMEKQLADVANIGLLGNFIGMLTDSRSFLSYTRHEYFRRILCNFVGGMAQRGECVEDLAGLGALVQAVSYHNTASFFGFDL